MGYPSIKASTWRPSGKIVSSPESIDLDEWPRLQSGRKRIREKSFWPDQSGLPFEHPIDNIYPDGLPGSPSVIAQEWKRGLTRPSADFAEPIPLRLAHLGPLRKGRSEGPRLLGVDQRDRDSLIVIQRTARMNSTSPFVAAPCRRCPCRGDIRHLRRERHQLPRGNGIHARRETRAGRVTIHRQVRGSVRCEVGRTARIRRNDQVVTRAVEG